MSIWPLFPHFLQSQPTLPSGHHVPLGLVWVAMEALTALAAFAVMERMRTARAGRGRRIWLAIGAQALLLAGALVTIHVVTVTSAPAVPLAPGTPRLPLLPNSLLALLVTTAVATAVGITLVGRRVDRTLTAMTTELSGREARYQAVLHAMADGLVTFDATGTIESANVAAECMLANAGPLAGGRLSTYIPALDVAALARLAADGRRTPTLGGRREMTARRADGSELPVEVAISEVPLEGHTVYSAVIRNITERVEGERHQQEYLQKLEATHAALKEQAEQLAVARDRAEEGARAKSDFLAMMSHELRTPMNGVLGMAQLLLHTPLSEEQAARVHMLRASGESLLRIINDVLDFSKIEAGKLSIESHVFDLPVLLEEVRETLATAADVVGLDLAVEVDASCPRLVVGDAGRIRQVLFNLAGNAIKFTDRGRVVIRACRAACAPGTMTDAIAFSVQDTGIGMTAETLELLFAPFTQGDGSSTRRHGGTGLGLAISRRLAEMMGGELTVTSAVRAGSCFTLTLALPAAPANARVGGSVSPSGRMSSASFQAAPFAAHEQGHGVHVLLAEDNMVNQVVVVALLAHLGCTVDVAPDGSAAVRRWSEGHFDLILMDCQMPGMDGLEATRQIRAAEAGSTHVPIVALTANAMPEDRMACLAAGMDDHIAKPVTEEALRNAIALARHNRQPQAAITGAR
ncbi:MAG: response regulator [Gemmatimonadaceae bacterium]|nr:response regulator [Gemmatimonadaceae bacterium]